MPSITFSSELSTAFCGLPERFFLTPSFLSALPMRIILPKQYESKQTIVPISQDTIYDSLLNRTTLAFEPPKTPQEALYTRKYIQAHYNKVCETHTLHVTSQDGIERIELKAKIASPKYVIYYPGNSEDSMNIITFRMFIQSHPDCNFIFWNYSGVGASAGHNGSVYDLYPPGLQQVRALRARGVPMKRITLNTRSLGGGIGLQVLRRLPQNADFPDILIERSFSATSAVLDAKLRMQLASNPKGRPLFSSVLLFGMLGMSIGLIVSGIIATVSLVLATIIAAAGYVLAALIMCVHACLKSCFPEQRSPSLAGLEKFAEWVNDSMTQLALWVHFLGNGLASIVGGLIAFVGLVNGIVFGMFMGAVLLLQLLVTNTPPLFFSLSPVIRFLAYIAHAEMDSVAALQDVLSHCKNTPTVTVYNTEDDNVISAEAALCTGLQFPHEEDPNTPLLPISEHIQCFWYKRGEHNYPMTEPGRSSVLNF